MKFRYTLPILAAAAIFAACDSTPEGDTAEVGEAQEVQEVVADATLEVETNNSKIGWIGLKPGGRHYGTLGLQDGTIKVSNGNIVGGMLKFDLNDINVEDLEGEDEQKLAGHLKSDEFFHVEEYPEATFEITSVEAIKGADNSNSQLSADAQKEVDDAADKFMPVVNNPTHRITGNLTMRGTTKSVTFPARVAMTDDGIQAMARFVIDRTQWGVNYGDESNVVDRTKDKFIYNNVAVGFDLVANK